MQEPTFERHARRREGLEAPLSQGCCDSLNFFLFRKECREMVGKREIKPFDELRKNNKTREIESREKKTLNVVEGNCSFCDFVEVFCWLTATKVSLVFFFFACDSSSRRAPLSLKTTFYQGGGVNTEWAGQKKSFLPLSLYFFVPFAFSCRNRL